MRYFRLSLITAMLFLSPFSFPSSIARGQASPRFLYGKKGRAGVHPTDVHTTRRIQGVLTEIISVDLTNPRVRITVQSAHGFPHGGERFTTMIHRSHPTIAVNGGFFDAGTHQQVSPLFAEGRLVYSGSAIGSAFFVTNDGKATIRRLRRDGRENWSGCRTALCAGPTLVKDGKVDVRAKAEGFTPGGGLMGSKFRMGLGLKGEGSLLLVCPRKPLTLERFAVLMRTLGCKAAMNLDGGSSRALRYRTATLASPSRPLTNLLLIHIHS